MLKNPKSMLLVNQSMFTNDNKLIQYSTLVNDNKLIHYSTLVNDNKLIQYSNFFSFFYCPCLSLTRLKNLFWGPVITTGINEAV